MLQSNVRKLFVEPQNEVWLVKILDILMEIVIHLIRMLRITENHRY